MLKPILSIYYLLACLLFIGCDNAKPEQCDIIVQPDIVNNSAYKKLNKEKETVSPIPWDTTKMKPKTSDIFYINDRAHPLSATHDRINSCWVYLDSNILRIQIGFNTGFGGSGFDIICTNSNYIIEPYLWSDADIDGNKRKPVFKVIKQSLILNKDKYFIGDSIFGKVDFKIIEDQKITHIGKGYFRGKVTKM